jgi:hypothetical protein
MTTFEIITLIIGSGIGFGIIRLLISMGKLLKTIEILQEDLHSIKNDIKSIDGRLNRLEGAFFERGQWEARSYKMAKNAPGKNLNG